MRAAPQKIIRAVFELHFRGRERVSSIQNRVSAFAGNRFHAVMAEGLSGMGRDRLLVFERVELDLGEVCISRLEDDLAAGIARCLKRWAFTASPSRSSLLPHFSDDGSGRSNDATRQDSLEMRQQRAGQRNSTTSGLSAAVAAALQEPADWSEFLAALRENHALRCRLADEISPKLLRRLAAALAPAEKPRIAEYAEEMIRLHERQPLLAVNVYVFRRALWEGIFCELAMRQPGGSNHSLFIQRILRRMARRHSCAYSEVANNLTLALKQNSSRAPLHDLLRQTAAELKAASPNSEPTHSSFTPLDDCQGSVITGNVSRRIDDLAKFLELGVLPWTLIAQGPETELLDLLATAPDELSAAILKLSAIEPVRKRLSSQFREGAASRLLATLAPGAASWMIAYMRQLRRITTQLAWSDLVLPGHIMEEVEEIKAWIEHRHTLLQDWGLKRQIKPGFRSLFYGPPGTGKTLTASLLGKSTGLDVYRIDLSLVVSKYIGETEKNLAKVFDQAERNDWILFFDEADALFGKRTQTASAHDRYANQEVAYLLQRIEDFSGVVILASNLKGNLDEAFARRFQSMIYFPMPGPEERAQLWRLAFSQQSRLEPAIDFSRIADKFEMSGGGIVNVLRSSSLATLRHGRTMICMEDIQHGIRREFRKDGKML